ncbi:MAG: hypothetical protein IT373_27085 [Polyangiaceae bacterium]|nr:hypothetical protein [Polyangiaceae bacterium]
MTTTYLDAAGAWPDAGARSLEGTAATAPSETLRERLASTGPLGLAGARALAAGLARALGPAHARGRFHGALEPGLVWLQGDGVVRLAPRPDTEPTGPGAAPRLRGPVAPAYRSPEQLLGIEAHGVYADLWTVAVLLYEALTGTSPFAGPSIVQTCLSVVHGRFAPPSSLELGLPESLDAFFARAFRKNRKERFKSMREIELGLVEDLDAA